MTDSSLNPKRVTCGVCSAQLRVPEGSLDNRFQCPRCGAAVTLAGNTPPRRTDRGDEPFPTAGSDAAEVYEFTVPCPLCGTRLDTTTEQIGRRLRCPDCHSDFAVVQPPPSKLRPRPRGTATVTDGELRIRSEPNRTVADEPWPTADAWPLSHEAADESSQTGSALMPANGANPFPEDVHKEIAAELLRKASAEAREQERETPPLPTAPFVTRLFLFLQEPFAVATAAMLGASLQVAILAGLSAAAYFNSTDPIAQFACVMLFVGTGVSGLLVLLTASTNMLCVLRETSEGRDRIENWPGFNVLESAGDLLYVAASLFYSVLPGFLLGSLFRSVIDSYWPLGIAIGISIYGLFPILLLSGLESGVPFFPVSTVVQGSLIRNSSAWLTFYLLSAPLALLVAACLAIQFLAGFLVGVLVGLVTMLLTMVYSRLLGRLTWICADTASETSAT